MWWLLALALHHPSLHSPADAEDVTKTEKTRNTKRVAGEYYSRWHFEPTSDELGLRVCTKLSKIVTQQGDNRVPQTAVGQREAA